MRCPWWHLGTRFVAAADVGENLLQAAPLATPPLPAAVGVVSPDDWPVVAQGREVLLAPALEVQGPEGIVALGPPAWIGGLLRRQYGTRLLHGVREVLAGRDWGQSLAQWLVSPHLKHAPFAIWSLVIPGAL